MKFHVEILTFIIRVGVHSDRWHKPYQVAVVGAGDGLRCHLKALTRPRGGFKPAHYKAIRAAVNSLGLKARWENKKRKRKQLSRKE